ncbi:MAG: response regulator [Deltaproteobacteria bacterium]|nr:response regulator [Deltaproteobacteria bacterium]
MTTAINILIVDDEPRNLDTLEAILAQPDYRLLRAQDADTALRLLLDHEVAAIVLDIQMPSVSGFELAQMIKTTKRFRETPIVFLTAFMLDDKYIVQGYGAGAVDYLTKPFNPQILRQKIAVFADLFRKTRALAELNETLEERVAERTAELEKSESALRAASKQKDEFLAVLAHELRNPLAPLRMGLDLLLTQQQQTPPVQRTLASMNRQLDHMVRLIDDLLDISRLSRGVLELKKEDVDLAAIVESTAETFRPIIERRRQVLEVSLPVHATVHADATRISQVIGNLLSNSIKFTPEGGKIRVELDRTGPNAIVRVSDSGIGIPDGQQETVFQMFARVQRAEGPGQPGLGIGLALARRLVEMHGGTIDAYSAGDSFGSTFTLVFPTKDLEQQEQRPAAFVAAAHRGFSPKKVLVIEDNEDIASTLADWLAERGHQVSVARDGREGVRLAQDVLPELVLCDLGLPEMDGLQVCRAIRASRVQPQPMIVALTGWGREDDRSRTKEAGFDHHLVKPVAVAELDKVLRSAAPGLA